MKQKTVVTLAVCSFLAVVSRGQETTFVGNVTGYWDDANSWNQPTAPINDTYAKVTVDSGISITLTNAASINRVAVNGGTGATLIIDGGSLSTDEGGWNAVGYNNSASLVLRNGGTLTTAGRLDVGMFDKIDGQVNTLTMESTSGNVSIGNVFRLGPNFDGLEGEAAVNATAQAFIKGGTLSASGLTIGSVGTTLMDFSGTGSAVINGDIRNDVADYVATSRMTASEAGKLVRATNVGGTTTIQAVDDSADYVRFEGSTTGVSGSGDGNWSNGANWRNQGIGYADGYAAGSNDTVRILANQAATLTDTAVIGGLLMGDNEDNTALVVDGGELRVVNPVHKVSWSAFSYNRSSTTEIKNGGSIHFEHAGNVFLGHTDNQDGTLVSLLVEDGELSVAGSLRLGSNYDASNDASVHMTIGADGTVDVGSLYIDNDNNEAGKGSVWLDLLEGGTLIANGDITSSIADWTADGRMLFNGDSAGVAGVDYLATVADGHTTVVAIPEPATLGLIAAFGGGILFFRRRFMI